MNPALKTWGISATIGNLEDACKTLLGEAAEKGFIIKAKTTKKIVVETILPPRIEVLPWAGYLGIRLIDQVINIIEKSSTTL